MSLVQQTLAVDMKESETAKVDAIGMLDDKIKELKALEATTKTSDKITKNTRGTQLYKISRDIRTLKLIKDLINKCPGKMVAMTPDSLDTFCLLTNSSKDRAARVVIEVHEGDMIFDILQKYSEVKDIYNKLTKAASNEGLVLDYASGKVVKPTVEKA